MTNIIEELHKIRKRAPDFFDALAKDDRSLIKENVGKNTNRNNG
jgi:hypothetical protein